MSPSEEDREGEDDEYSFYRFSVLHFQGDATHTHIAQRLREPLLRHGDKGDALVDEAGGMSLQHFGRGGGVKNVSFLRHVQACLTVWWLILRFMEDLPEPTSPETAPTGPRPVSRNMPMRKGIRLDNNVGLEEV